MDLNGVAENAAFEPHEVKKLRFEAIEGQPEGPMMDYLIARDVMGQNVIRSSDGAGWVIIDEVGRVYGLPRYSTKIGTAWDVACRFDLSVLKVRGGWQARKEVSMRDETSSNASTAALAICRCALKAVKA